MAELEYKLTNDVLFKMLFVKEPHLLRHLVAALLGIPLESITAFVITNPEITPEFVSEKFCRLDINMVVNGDRVDLEVQVGDKGDYRERSLYYWSREYSSALPKGGDYKELPRTVVMSILGFNMFKCDDFISEFEILETRRHERLTDKLYLKYFELLKLPKTVDADDKLSLWLSLFAARKEEDFARIKGTGVLEMTQAIEAYHSMVATSEFKNLEKMRFLASCNEASALRYAREQEREKWQSVVADERRKSEEWQSVVAKKDTALAEKDAENAALKAQLAQLLSQRG